MKLRNGEGTGIAIEGDGNIVLCRRGLKKGKKHQRDEGVRIEPSKKEKSEEKLRPKSKASAGKK
jgi:hypothetical protein